VQPHDCGIFKVLIGSILAYALKSNTYSHYSHSDRWRLYQIGLRVRQNASLQPLQSPCAQLTFQPISTLHAIEISQNSEPLLKV
jgi:hypothetical protein